MSKNYLLIYLEGADNLLQQQIHAAKNDPDYPIDYDFKALSNAKDCIGKAELLLKKTRTKTAVKKTDKMAASR